MLKTVTEKKRPTAARPDRPAVDTRADDRRLFQPMAIQSLGLGLLGGVLLWAAFPPVNMPWLAWIAPVPWLWLARQPKSLGWQGYLGLWLAGFAHWLLMLEGIRLAHPALYAGWIALAAYLGVYVPVFVGLTRVAVQRLNKSPLIAAPLVWVGLELLRGHLITGFSMGLLAHTQAEFVRLIQISDLAGGYTLSAMIMFVAACIAEAIPGAFASGNNTPSRRLLIKWPFLKIAALGVVAMLLYGQWRLIQVPKGLGGPKARVALIQGSLDTVFDVSAEKAQERIQQTFDHYRRLTNEAIYKNTDLDLVAWPESMFAVSETRIDEPLIAPSESGFSSEQWRNRLTAAQDDFRGFLASEVQRLNAGDDGKHGDTKLLVGTITYSHGSGLRIYNSALLSDPAEGIVGRYYKTHPVMFGEYIPFGEAFPWLYKLTPMASGLSVGSGPTAFPIGGLSMSPSICFESTIPHLIRGQLAQLQRRGTPADVLVNVTNDGWFWGSGMLDLHFRCGVFRAVENRKPLLVAANTGISTLVDGNGAIRQRGPRRQEAVLIADVHADGRDCLYAWLGDIPAWFCAACCLGLVGFGLVGRQSQKLLADKDLSSPRKTPNLP